MKICIAMKSESAIKRTKQAQVAATKSFPKTAALIHKLSEKIKKLRKEALKNYFKRKQEDKLKATKKKSSHSSYVVLSDALLDRAAELSDADMADCCAEFESDSAVSVETSAQKTKDAKSLKKAAVNPKAALRKKQMAAAMRIRENKELRIEIKKLLEMKKKLQDKAWALYVKKVGSKKKDKPVKNSDFASAKKRVLEGIATIKDRYKLKSGGSSQVRVPKLAAHQLTQATEKLAGELHGQWQKEYKAANGADAKRIKKTKDEAWIKANGGKDEVDIANTDFKNLPSDWKKENAEAAKAAVDAVHGVNKVGALNVHSLEKASDSVHKKWLERNGSWAPENQKLPFKKLSQEEADKDRAHVTQAIKIMQSLAPIKRVPK